MRIHQMVYSKEIADQVWENARAMPDKDPTEWRKDECGAWIKREHYGNNTSEFGWKIERVSPGGDTVFVRRPTPPLPSVAAR